MPRLFVDPERLGAVGGELPLRGPEHHYLVHVLRGRPGDKVTLLDGSGREVTARIAGAEGTVLELVAEKRAAGEGPRVTLLLGLLKGEKFDLVVQKATELGVCRIVPLRCARSVARPDDARAAARRARWERIARAAAGQCRRPQLPEIAAPQDPGPALAMEAAELRLVLWEGALRQPLRDLLPAPLPATIAVLVGPEGGLADEEVRRAEECGYLACGLGPRILRAETAAIAVLAALVFASG